MSEGDGMAKHPKAEPGYGDQSKQPRWHRKDKINMSVQKKWGLPTGWVYLLNLYTTFQETIDHTIKGYLFSSPPTPLRLFSVITLE